MTAPGDISWDGPAGTFNLRTAAIIVRGGRILVCTVDGIGYWYLPGGRARLGEPGEVALARELAEELGHRLPVGRLALVVENIYRGPEVEHEIGLYYPVAWPDGLAEDDLTGGIEPGLRFRWVPLPELGSPRFEPAGLIPVLQNPADGLRHVLLS
ncbi:MAG TPA: NUDIX domain-containing protein [Streptosporangiaceae bacterium]